ncbi:MAG: hypothetical protein M1834_001347 [Cirrosporium novae-zelandiae]|nr:MAG: hypothetical protein M1834_001347 [Cirrosporium novae-zelandiae]
MDPISVIGFAASIASLSGLVVESIRSIHDIWGKLQNADQDISRLLSAVQDFEAMVELLKSEQDTCKTKDKQAEKRIEGLFSARVAEMADDIAKLNLLATELERSLSKKSLTGKNLRGRVRKYFSDDKIAYFEERLSRHRQFLFFLLLLKSNSDHPDQKPDTQSSQLIKPQQLEPPILHLHISPVVVGQLIEQEAGKRLETPNSDLWMTEDHISKANKSVSRTQQASIDSTWQTGNSLKRTIDFKWLNFHSALGDLTIAASCKQGARRVEFLPRQSLNEIEITLYALPWLADYLIKMSLIRENVQNGLPSFKWSLSTASYNANPALIAALRSPTLSAIQHIFSQGLASPNDIIPPWGRTLLHEVIFSSLAGVPGSIRMCEFLIQAGADLNARSVDGSTPLLLCCELMHHEILEQRLRPIASLLMSTGADPTLLNPNGYSAISMIFDTMRGPDNIQSLFCAHINPITFEETNHLDSWILATVARSFPQFQHRLLKQLEEFRTPQALSSSQRPPPSIVQLDIDHQVSQILQADPVPRQIFMRLLCRRGTAKMLDPLLQQGLDVNEGNDGVISFLGEAAANGNKETLSSLLKTGAYINSGRKYSALDALLEHWGELRNAKKYEAIEEERSIFEQLIVISGISSPDALTRTIAMHDHSSTERLLQAGFGRKLDSIPRGLYLFSGSEVIETVKHRNVRALHLLIKHGAYLEFEDVGGYTALLHALDKGYLELVHILFEANAELQKQASSGLMPKEFIRRNLLAPHPRTPALFGSFASTDSMGQVSYEDDLKAHNLLMARIEVTGSLYSRSLRSLLPLKQYSRSIIESGKTFPNTYTNFQKCLLASLLGLLFYKTYEVVWFIAVVRQMPKPSHVATIALWGFLFLLLFG